MEHTLLVLLPVLLLPVQQQQQPVQLLQLLDGICFLGRILKQGLLR